MFPKVKDKWNEFSENPLTRGSRPRTLVPDYPSFKVMVIQAKTFKMSKKTNLSLRRMLHNTIFHYVIISFCCHPITEQTRGEFVFNLPKPSFYRTFDTRFLWAFTANLLEIIVGRWQRAGGLRWKRRQVTEKHKKLHRGKMKIMQTDIGLVGIEHWDRLISSCKGKQEGEGSRWCAKCLSEELRCGK